MENKSFSNKANLLELFLIIVLGKTHMNFLVNPIFVLGEYTHRELPISLLYMKQIHPINQVREWNLEKYIVQIVKKYLDAIILNSTMIAKLRNC